jgi:hypothetical protein
MLFGSTLLEVAIGVIFVYLLVSLLCSALNEFIEAILRNRASDLEKGIRKLLDDPSLADALLEHPLVKPLGDRPSYIPARTFSLALWNLATTWEGRARAAEAVAASLKQKAEAGATDVAAQISEAETAAAALREKAKDAPAGLTQDLDAIRQFVAGLDEGHYKNIKTSLLALMDEAEGDITKARENVEKWYNDAMDRVSGWYKRRTNYILIVIGLVAAFALNIDTIQITKALYYNDTLRSSVATAAQEYAKSHPVQQNAAGDPDAQQAETKIKTITADINALGLPIGWNSGGFPKDNYDGFLKILGLILTGLAVSQGAPFWFDILNKFIVIRSTVKPREKSQPEGSKDKKPNKT